MIDSKFIISYTNALYSTNSRYSPTYDEFRDMFSSGQIYSKEWIINELSKLTDNANRTAVIVGAWFGTLGILLKNNFPDMNVKLLDIDPRCAEFLGNIIYSYKDMSCITGDMYAYTYTEDIIINTSCEHIPDVSKWLSLIPPGTRVVLQSNNFLDGNGHVNCVNSTDEFKQQANLSTIEYIGQLDMPMYTRYMIIGRV